MTIQFNKTIKEPVVKICTIMVREAQIDPTSPIPALYYPATEKDLAEAGFLSKKDYDKDYNFMEDAYRVAFGNYNQEHKRRLDDEAYYNSKLNERAVELKTIYTHIGLDYNFAKPDDVRVSMAVINKNLQDKTETLEVTQKQLSIALDKLENDSGSALTDKLYGIAQGLGLPSINGIEKAIQDLQIKNNELQATNKTLQKQLDGAKEDYTLIKKDRDNFAFQHEINKNNVRSASAKIEELQSKVKELDGQLVSIWGNWLTQERHKEIVADTVENCIQVVKNTFKDLGIHNLPMCKECIQKIRKLGSL